MIQKPMLVMQHCQPLMPTSQFQEMLIFQFQKILNQNFKKLILVCWSGVPDCINKYVIIMLINMMKSDEFTLTMMFSNLIWLHTKNPDQNIIVIAFKSLGFSWKNFCWYTAPTHVKSWLRPWLEITFKFQHFILWKSQRMNQYYNKICEEFNMLNPIKAMIPYILEKWGITWTMKWYSSFFFYLFFYMLLD